jgi:hypothetical protein
MAAEMSSAAMDQVMNNPVLFLREGESLLVVFDMLFQDIRYLDRAPIIRIL